MLLIREVFHCKPGKVRPMLEKMKAMAGLGEKHGMPKPRIMTDLTGSRYWTVISEFEVESFDAFMKMGADPDQAREFEAIMKGYHDLIDSGHREIYTIEA